MHRLAILAASLFLTSAAFAADAVHDASTTGPYDWSGPYVGVQLGYGWGSATAFELRSANGSLSDGPLDYDVNGMLGGVHAGYIMQSDALVYGAEADIEYSGVDCSWDWGNGNGLSKDIRWTGSLRGRLGYAFDRVMIYGTAGVAFASVHMDVIDSGSVALSKSETTVGWTAGAGVGYALTDRVSVRAEYRYADYGDTSISGDVFGGQFTYPHDNKVHAVRIGASLKF